MKILKIFTVCFVLLNLSMFHFVTSNNISKSVLENKENLILYEKFLNGVNVKKSASETTKVDLTTQLGTQTDTQTVNYI